MHQHTQPQEPPEPETFVRSRLTKLPKKTIAMLKGTQYHLIRPAKAAIGIVLDAPSKHTSVSFLATSTVRQPNAQYSQHVASDKFLGIEHNHPADFQFESRAYTLVKARQVARTVRSRRD